MDPLSITASAAGIIGFAATSAKVLYQLIEDAKDAPKDVIAISAETRAFEAVLCSLGALVNDGTIKDDAASSLEAPLLNCLSTLTSLSDKIRPYVKKHGEGKTRWKSSISWTFKKDDIAKLSDRLIQNKMTLSTVLSIIHTTKLQGEFQMLRTEMNVKGERKVAFASITGRRGSESHDSDVGFALRRFLENESVADPDIDTQSYPQSEFGGTWQADDGESEYPAALVATGPLEPLETPTSDGIDNQEDMKQFISEPSHERKVVSEIAGLQAWIKEYRFRLDTINLNLKKNRESHFLLKAKYDLESAESQAEAAIVKLKKSLPPPAELPTAVETIIPQSHEEMEAVLEKARSIVLESNDPEMQLNWAEHTLSWVEVAQSNRTRAANEETPGKKARAPPTEYQLRVDALGIIKSLAEQSMPKALFMKAMWYEFGKFGYLVDEKEAYLIYSKASDMGYARAEYRMGMRWEMGGNKIRALEHYNCGMALGDSPSNYRLGIMSLFAQHGQPQDSQLGIDRIRNAAMTADDNAPQGAYVYGMLLSRELPGISVSDSILPVDINQARTFIAKAAHLGFSKAQLKMGQAYELCLLGCQFDPLLSLRYFKLAACQGEPEAEMGISKWFLCGFEGGIDKDEELAFKYAKRAASSQLPTAEFAMGYFYEIGIYVKPDVIQALSWYQKAADNGVQDAATRLKSLTTLRQQTLAMKDTDQPQLS